MGTLEKLKAYFGMIPADEYPDERYHRGYEDVDQYDEREPQMPRRRTAYRVDEVDDMDVPARPRQRRPVDAPLPGVSGALAMERQPEPVTRLRVAEQPLARDPLSRIVTLHPSSYPEAREIGEAFRAGNPVIMNLTEMENADAKRLVDFAAGLAFALRGSMDKVTNKVFLLSPSGEDMSAEDRKRIAEGGLSLRR